MDNPTGKPPLLSAKTAPQHRATIAGICIVLMVLVWGVFGQMRHFDFINYDDNAHVYDNPAVKRGFSVQGIAWAFTHLQVGDWFPLATLSHMLDYQLFGLHAGGHHVTSVLLHGIATILLFLVLREMTGATWRSAFAAAVFAVHPLHAESVAWISERKDVLSGVFFMLVIAAWLRYTRRHSATAYALALIFFALGLMSKSMLVTLPLLLLILDYWPLRRGELPASNLWRLLFEKVPFFALSGAACVVQILSSQGGAIVTMEKLPLASRIANALVSCALYIRQMLWPADLCVFYPHPKSVPPWEAIFSILLLGSISWMAFAWRRKYPYLLAGWLWYLLMLAPVIGVVQVGEQAHADRYTYLPQIGLAIVVVWLAADFCKSRTDRRVIAGAAGALIIAALTWRASIQASYWQDSTTLWKHALDVADDNVVAEMCLASAYAASGKPGDAISHYQKALEFKPDNSPAHDGIGLCFKTIGQPEKAAASYRRALEIDPANAEARNNLGLVLTENKQFEEAILQFQKGLESKPDSPQIHYNYANALSAMGRGSEAIAEYRAALELEPVYAEARNNLGIALMNVGQLDEAISAYQKAVEINPGFAEAHYNLARTFRRKNRPEVAITEYQKVLQIEPDYVPAQNNLAYLLATCPQASLRDGTMAVKLAMQANQSTGGENPMVLGTLAAAYAECGRFPEAVETVQHAINSASKSNPAITELLQSQLALYQAGKPFRSDASSGK